jgi:tRNA-2-methylthio-N6-dimethylallyladenosine synthase
MKLKTVHLFTIGCQMNVHDSEQILRGLNPLGYRFTESAHQADLVIVNTCTIRAKAEQKAFSLLGRLAEWKRDRPQMIIGVGGCLAQQEGQKIFDRAPHVDLVFGTQAIGRLPDLLRRIEQQRCRIVDVEMTGARVAFGPGDAHVQNVGVSHFVTIMQGCDNFCTYCVVPHVRGRETSRPPEAILAEIQTLVSAGVREVTLLGQNVNSYGKKEGLCSFAQLLERIDAIPGLLRIRFTTSHPKDLSEDLMVAIRDLEKVCTHIHLPVQSGANDVLKRMNRRYTRESYLDKVNRLRSLVADIAITSDIIAGFPGETHADFSQTLDLIRTVGFDSLFAFIYSDRPSAPAAGFRDKVAEPVKKDRLSQILELQGRITMEKHRAQVARTLPVLVEGYSKRQKETTAEWPEAIQWSGRTEANTIVNFIPGNDAASCARIETGRIVNVQIERALSHSLWGTPVCDAGLGLKGEPSYAA